MLLASSVRCFESNWKREDSSWRRKTDVREGFFLPRKTQTQTSSEGVGWGGGLQYDHNHETTIALPLETRSTFTFSLHNNVRSLLLAQDAVYGSVFMRTLPCHGPALKQELSSFVLDGKLKKELMANMWWRLWVGLQCGIFRLYFLDWPSTHLDN